MNEMDAFSYHWQEDASIGQRLDDHRNLVEFLAWNTKYFDFYPQYIHQLKLQDVCLSQLFEDSTGKKLEVGWNAYGDGQMDYVRGRPSVLDRELSNGCVVLAHFGVGDAEPFPENAPDCGGEGGVFKTPNVEGGIILTTYNTTDVASLVKAFKVHLQDNGLTLLMVMQQGRQQPVYYEDDGHIV